MNTYSNMKIWSHINKYPVILTEISFLSKNALVIIMKSFYDRIKYSLDDAIEFMVDHL